MSTRPPADVEQLLRRTYADVAERTTVGSPRTSAEAQLSPVAPAARSRRRQLVAAAAVLAPIGGEPGTVYGLGTAVRVDDERIIWRASTMTDDEPPAGHYVVWSSASPTGRRLDPIRYSDVESLLWIMEPGEAPWGYQTIGDDGTLVAHTTFVGLPAD